MSSAERSLTCGSSSSRRGLPRTHILIILDNHAITATQNQVDSIVCSELPPDPAATDDPEIKERRQKLQEIVVTSMIHGPCGAANPLSPCMENGRCTKSSNTEQSWTPTTAILYTEGDIPMTVDARSPIRRPEDRLTVYALRIHLEEEQQVVFSEGDEENSLEMQRNS